MSRHLPAVDLCSRTVADTPRLFKGFYFGVLFKAFIMGWVFLAVIKVLGALVAGLEQRGMGQKLHFVPAMNRDNLGPVSVFLTYILVQWWAHKYADGGGKHIQRMLSAQNEQHAFAATLLYAFINYAIQVWPWILTALASLLLFEQLADPEQAYAMTMARVLPAGLLGLVLLAFSIRLALNMDSVAGA